MELTPLQIRKQEFARLFRGYDPEEVRSFLELVAHQWDELNESSRKMHTEVSTLRGKVEHYEALEEVMKETLTTTKQKATRVQADAEGEAARIVQEAEAEAAALTRYTNEERTRFSNEMAQFADRCHGIVRQARELMSEEVERLARFEASLIQLAKKEGPTWDEPRVAEADADEEAWPPAFYDEEEAPETPEAPGLVWFEDDELDAMIEAAATVDAPQDAPDAEEAPVAEAVALEEAAPEELAPEAPALAEGEQAQDAPALEGDFPFWDDDFWEDDDVLTEDDHALLRAMLEEADAVAAAQSADEAVADEAIADLFPVSYLRQDFAEAPAEDEPVSDRNATKGMKRSPRSAAEAKEEAAAGPQRHARPPRRPIPVAYDQQ